MATITEVDTMRGEWVRHSARIAEITRTIETLSEQRAELETRAAELSREYRAIVGGN